MNLSAFMTTSWDDGHPLDHKLADLLTKYGLTGTFYIPKQAENQTMSEAQLHELARDFEIGAHTMHHTFLDSSTDLTAEREITESKSWVEDVTGKPCSMFCPPGGRFNPSHLRMIAAAGYTGARSVELLSLAEPQRNGDLLILPTTIQAYPHERQAYFRNALKRLAVKNLWSYVKLGTPTDWVGLADTLLQHVSKFGGVFHLWGHSWELQETHQWKRLEDMFVVMSRYLPTVPCVNNSELCHRTMMHVATG